MEPRSPPDESHARQRGAAVAVAYLAALLAIGAAALTGPPLLVDLAFILTLVLGAMLVADRLLERHLAGRRAATDASYARMLRGLSRSVSPDAIVSGIIEDLRSASGADHVALARLRPGTRVVEATFVSAGQAVPPSTTTMPADVLDAGIGPEALEPEAIAERVAERLQGLYGLHRVLAAPLVTDGRVSGALVLSLRTEGPWPAAQREVLAGAASEVSAALARVDAFEVQRARASLDALTGLPNRRHFDELAAVFARGRRQVDGLGLLMIDIDHFKQLNDRYGHATGDGVLRAVAAAIAGSVRADETPTRYGGEEFAVVLRRASRTTAVEVARRIHAAVGALRPSDMAIAEPVSVSVGVAAAGPSPTALGELVERADRALYEAKGQGRDRVVLEGDQPGA